MVDLRELPEEEQTPEICLAAVQKDGDMLKYVKNQTSEICWAAIKNSRWSFSSVKEDLQTPEMCLFAVKRWDRALNFISNQTPELCLASVRASPNSLQYIDSKLVTLELCIEATKHSYTSHNIDIITNMTNICTSKLQLDAMNQNTKVMTQLLSNKQKNIIQIKDVINKKVVNKYSDKSLLEYVLSENEDIEVVIQHEINSKELGTYLLKMNDSLYHLVKKEKIKKVTEGYLYIGKSEEIVLTTLKTYEKLEIND